MSACVYPTVRFVKRVGQRVKERTVTPCGVCNHCRVGKAAQWGTRLTLELLSWPSDVATCSLTLTYSNSHLPAGGSLRKLDLQSFWKRLRHFASSPLRYLAAGEYGSDTFRPHYHACVIGYRPSDLVFYKSTSRYTLFTSARLSRLWRLGEVFVGSLTYSSATYCAKYTVKRQSADREFFVSRGLVPPFIQPSTCPGLGALYIKDHLFELSRDRIQVAPGIVSKVPDFIMSHLDKEAHETYLLIKARRRRVGAALVPASDHAAREAILARRISERVDPL